MKAFVNCGLVVLVISSAGWALGSSGAPRNPIGETANYTVDKDSNRTSGIIKSGTLVGTIADANTDGANYDMKIDYDFKITFLGEKTGTKMIAVPNAYFTPDFMTTLRQTGHYESAKFKIDYEGTEDATTTDGHSYPGCDKVKIYDIQDQASLPLVSLAVTLLGASPQADIENLEINADIFPGVPVLGAVRLDVSGTYSGMDVKAGGDYQAP